MAKAKTKPKTKVSRGYEALLQGAGGNGGGAVGQRPGAAVPDDEEDLGVRDAAEARDEGIEGSHLRVTSSSENACHPSGHVSPHFRFER